ncbi:MAG: hypothetical protein ACYDDF_01680 [Thermoplasmatota archaeon]
MPILIVYGKDDTFVPAALASEIHAGIEGRVLVEVTRGQVVAVRADAQVVEAIEIFLASAPAWAAAYDGAAARTGPHDLPAS